MPTHGEVPSSNQDVVKPALPRIGEWLWTCRAGSEVDLCEELESLRVPARPIEPGLVASSKRPSAELAFARQGLPVQAICPAEVEAIAAALRPQLRRHFALHVFSPDSDVGNRLAARAQELAAAVAAALTAAGLRVVADGPGAHTEGGLLAQVCLLGGGKAVCGVQSAATAPSLFPGGVQRVRRPKDAPSRSAHKLAEALAWLGHGPESGDRCIDLGAAPGGWSQVLADRRCQVLAVDPGSLAPAVARRVDHLRANAFNFVPDDAVDWVVCDMAYRPLEVAALLARWGRRRWARFLLANIKLPMKKRVAMLARVRDILESGGWTGLRVRQLYHDRDEVTLFAWRGFGLDTRVPNRSGGPASGLASEAEPTARPSRKPETKPGQKLGRSSSPTRSPRQPPRQPPRAQERPGGGPTKQKTRRPRPVR